MAYKLKVPYDTTKAGDLAQLECLRRALAKKRYGVFFQQRVGKTRVAIDFIGKQIADGARRVLVLCPLCAQAGWKAQFGEYLGSTGKTVNIAVIQRTSDVLPKLDDALIVVCTYDKASLMKEALAKWAPDVVICDEAHLLKNRTSGRSKTAYVITRKAKFVLGLTGTPYSNKKYSDLFGLFRAINPEVFGARWADFERRFCKKGGYMGYDIVGYEDEDVMLRRVDANSMRVLRKDVMAEPEKEDIRVHVEMTPTELKYYKSMERDCVVFLEEQPRVTADMVTTQRLKLQQITSGVVKGDEGEMLEVGKSKLETALDLIDTIEGKVVVVCRYTADVKRLRKAMDYSLCIDGSHSEVSRERIVKEWQTGSRIRVLIVQEQTMSMGVDLSAASDMIFYSWGEDSLTHSQVRDRILGRNQKEDIVHYHYMSCDGTIDELMYKSLKQNISFAEKAANWRRWICP